MALSVAPVSGSELGEACRLLAALRPPGDRVRAAERYRALFESHELDPAGLFIARAGTALRGAMLVQPMPGALGLAWPPVVANRRNRSTIEDRLVAAASQWLQAQGVKVCQAFAGELEVDSLAALVRGGFRRTTRLLDFECPLERAEDLPGELAFIPLASENRTVFRDTLLASFAGSLDCPEIVGSRSEAELLHSYGMDAAGPREWFRVDRGHEPIGVVLLEAAAVSRFELTYVGIVPDYRGRGLGRELIRFAQQHARNRGATHLDLSVDERNHPALGLYRAQGFQASGARLVFLAHWPASS